MKYLPNKYKNQIQSQRNVVTQCVTTEEQFVPIPNKIIEIKSYVNTNFVNVCIQKKFFKRIINKADKLGTKPDILIYNTLIQMEKIFKK
jgi:hypothetical protein